MKPYRFHPRALAEYESAVSWYADRSLEATVGLAELGETGIASIRRHPEAWPMWPGRLDVRRRVLRRFPYSLIYVLDPEITIVALAHHRRRPGYWLQRLRSR